MDGDEARAALASVRATNDRIARDLGVCTPWRHIIVGLLMALLVGAITFSLAAQLVANVFVILVAVWLIRRDRQRTGVFVNGYRRGRTLPVTLAMIVVLAGMAVAAFSLRENHAGWLPKLGLAALAFVVATCAGFVWQWVWRRELGQDS